MLRGRKILFLWLVPLVMLLAILAGQAVWHLSMARLEWEQQLPGYLEASCTSADGELLYLLMADYNTSPGLFVYCYRRSGGLRWKHELKEFSYVFSGLSIRPVAGGLLVSYQDREACMLDEWGEFQWSNTASPLAGSAMLSGGNAVFCLSQGGRLVGFGSDGTALWQAKFGSLHLSALDIRQGADDGSFVAVFTYTEASRSAPDADGVPPPASKYSLIRRYSADGQLLQEDRVDGIDGSGLEKQLFSNGALVMYFCDSHGSSWSADNLVHGVLRYLPAGQQGAGLQEIRLDGKLIHDCQPERDSLLLMTEDVWRLDQDGSLVRFEAGNALAICSGQGGMFYGEAEYSPLSWLQAAGRRQPEALAVRRIPPTGAWRPRWRIAYEFPDRPDLQFALLGDGIVLIHDRDVNDGMLDISCYR